MSIEDELRAFNRSYHIALANRDLASILDHFERDGRVMVPGLPPVVGHDAIRAFFEAGSDDGVDIKSYAIHEIYQGGDLVIEIGSEVFSGRRADGTASEFPMSSVGVYRRRADGQLGLLVDCVSPDRD